MTSHESYLATVFLTPELYNFVVNRENLDAKSPVLDLSKPLSVIRKELYYLCKKANDLITPFSPNDGGFYTQPLRFIPSETMAKYRRYHLDTSATRHFNQFLLLLRNELAYEHVSQTLPPEGSTIKDALIHFTDIAFKDNDDFDWEALKRREYELRKLRNQPIM